MTAVTRADLVEAWRSLRQRYVSLDIRQLNAEELGNGFEAAVDAQGRAHLLVPCPERIKGANVGAVSVQHRPWVVEGTPRPYLDLACADPTLDQSFAWLGEEVLRRIAAGENSPSAVLTALSDMRELLVGGRNMSEEEAIGLVGELEVLERLLTAHGPTALGWWRGPEGARHDFVGPAGRVEVKATTALDSGAITLHGLWQADAAGTALVVAQVEAGPAGATLPARIARVAELCGDERGLIRLLAGTGYSEDSEWSGVPYELVLLRAWSMDDPFPAIRRSMLPVHVADAIESLRYRLRLAALPAGSALDVDRLIGEMA